MMHVTAMSFVVVFREALEAIVLLAAMATSVIHARQDHRIPAILVGATAALCFGAVSAWLIVEYLPDIDDAILALSLSSVAALLCYSGAWLWRMENLGHWHVYLEVRVRDALKLGSPFLLGLTAFVCVLREFAEATLILRAMSTAEAGVAPAMILGIAVALSGWGGCYFLASVVNVRMPIRMMLSLSSFALFALGLHFVGDVVQQLQSIGLVKADPIPVPTWFATLGIHPTSQVLVVQVAIIVAASIIALLTSRKDQARS